MNNKIKEMIKLVKDNTPQPWNSMSDGSPFRMAEAYSKALIFILEELDNLNKQNTGR